MRARVWILAAVMMAAAVTAGADDDREAIRQCRTLLKTAVEACEAGRYAEAQPVLDEVLVCDPDSPDAFYWQGRAHLALGDTTAAVEVLSAGIETAPLSTRLKVLLARIRLDQGSAEDAAALLVPVLMVKPRHGEALYLRGLTHLAAGDTLAALDDWDLALDAARREERR